MSRPHGWKGVNIKPFVAYIPIRKGISMSTEFCTHCKQSHPGRVCDFDDQGECAETIPQPDAPAAKSAPAKEASVQPQPGTAIDRA
jgi:hypothetical protein